MPRRCGTPPCSTGSSAMRAIVASSDTGKATLHVELGAGTKGGSTQPWCRSKAIGSVKEVVDSDEASEADAEEEAGGTPKMFCSR